MAHLHDVIDDDLHFKIDPETRAITRDSENEVVLIKGDHDSERLTFEIPREIDGHDMTLCNRVQFHFINLDKSNPEDFETGIVVVKDLEPAEDDNETLIFTALIPGEATGKVGPMNFAINFVCYEDSVDEEGNSIRHTTYSWSTAPYIGIIVSDTIIATYDSEDYDTTYYSIIDTWLNDVRLAAVAAVASVNDAKAKAVTEIVGSINGAKEAAKSEIDKHVEELKDSLVAEELTVADILVQQKGQSAAKVMSQKSVTDSLDGLESNLATDMVELEANVNAKYADLQTKFESTAKHQKCEMYDVNTKQYRFTPFDGDTYRVYCSEGGTTQYPWGFYAQLRYTLMGWTGVEYSSPNAQIIELDQYPSDIAFARYKKHDIRLCGARITTLTPYESSTAVTVRIFYEVNGNARVWESTTTVPITGVDMRDIEVNNVQLFIYGVTANAVDTLSVYKLNDDITDVSFRVDANGISDIKKTKTNGLVDTYTIVLDDGTTKDFTVKNGNSMVGVEKTGATDKEVIYTIYMGDGSTMTFSVYNGENDLKRINIVEDEVEEMYDILSDVGVTEFETVSGIANDISVPEKSISYATVKSFGGMTRRVAVPSAQGKNYLPFPYMDNNFGTDGAGTIELVGPMASVALIDSDCPVVAPYDGYFKFVTNAEGGSTDMAIDIVHPDGTRAIATEVYIEDVVEIAVNSGDAVVLWCYNNVDDSPDARCTIKPAIYFSEAVYDEESGGNVPSGYYEDTEWVARYATYKLEDTKVIAIKSVGEGVEHVYPIPEEIQNLEGYGRGVNETAYAKVDLKKKTFAYIESIILDGVTTKINKVSQANGYYYASIPLSKPMTSDQFVISHFNMVKASDVNWIPGNSYVTGDRSIIAMYNQDQTLTTVSQWNTWLAQQYAKGTPVTIVYETTDPAVTDLPVLFNNRIEVEPNGHVYFVTDTGKEIPVEVEFTKIGSIVPGGGESTPIGTITFTGAVNETYDGSKNITVEIPDGSDIPLPSITFTGATSAMYDGTKPIIVNIPEGGSGGGGSSDIIETETTTTEVSTITFDGNIEGKAKAVVEETSESAAYYVKVNDAALTLDLLDGNTLSAMSLYTPGGVMDVPADKLQQTIAEPIGNDVAAITWNGMGLIVFVAKDGAVGTIRGGGQDGSLSIDTTFPEAGIYVTYGAAAGVPEVYCAGFTLTNPISVTTTKSTLTEEFQEVFTNSEIGVIKVETKEVNFTGFTWDGDTTGRTAVDVGGVFYYKLDDVAIPFSDLENNPINLTMSSLQSGVSSVLNSVSNAALSEMADGAVSIQGAPYVIFINKAGASVDINGDGSVIATFDEVGVYSLGGEENGMFMYVSEATLRTPYAAVQTEKSLTDSFWEAFESEITIGGKY